MTTFTQDYRSSSHAYTMLMPTILLTNDDGPPGTQSPYIYGFHRYLTKHLGWDVKVVLPSSQKSWIGNGYQITHVVQGTYYYPKDPDGHGEVSHMSRPLKDGEVAEWILLDSTPATCANVALHNIYPNQIDLLISGPNFGRNISSALSLSSGTIGAALSSSLSRIRSIAISYGTVLHPTPTTFFEPAHILGMGIIGYLWSSWGRDNAGLRNSEVDFYNVNIPLVAGLLDDSGLKVCWTRMWHSSYGRLFKPIPSPVSVTQIQRHISTTSSDSLGADLTNIEGPGARDSQEIKLVFEFAPDITGLINPELSSLPVGTDGWANAKGWASVTPLRAVFAEPSYGETLDFIGDAEDGVWKIKL